MKRLSALFLIVAVLNPLCCCLSSAENSKQPDPAQDHSCCPGDSEQNQAHHQSPSDCQHKMLSDKGAVIAPDNSLHATPFVAQVDPVFELFDVVAQYASQCTVAPRPLESTQIVAWIRTQTNCVRLL